MLCAPTGVGLSAKGWLYELKLDGVRIVADKRGDKVDLWYRKGNDATHSYPEIARAVARLPVKDAVLDGEVVAFGVTGKPSFQKLEGRIGLGRKRDVEAATKSVPVAYIVFDLIALEEHDLRELPLLERRRVLQEILPNDGCLRSLEWVEDDGTSLFDVCRRERLEGVIAKRALSPYRSGLRSDDWVKIKCVADEDFVVVGYTRGTSGHGELVVRGKVGSGIGEKAMRELVTQLSALVVDAPQARGVYVPAPRGRTHVRPEVTVSVRYASWTDEGRVRHPVFRGVRADVHPTECRGTPARSSLHEELADYFEAVGATLLRYLDGRSSIEGPGMLARTSPPFRVHSRGWIVLDCDVAGALGARSLFAELGLPAFAKTGDQTDYQVIVAVGEASREGAAALAEIATRLVGGRARVATSPMLAPYSPLAGAGSRVSTPLAWEEVVPALDPRRLTTRTIAARLAKAGDPMAALLGVEVDFRSAVRRLEARLAGAGGGAT